MHSDMGDEGGIRLRCICLGDAALRGSRMSARARCSKVSEPCFARSSLSIARSSVCAVRRCLRINITIRQKKIKTKETKKVSALYMFAVALGLAKSAHGATPDDHIATDDYIRRETEKSLDEVEHVFQLEQAPPPACTSAKNMAYNEVHTDCQILYVRT